MHDGVIHVQRDYTSVLWDALPYHTPEILVEANAGDEGVRASLGY